VGGPVALLLDLQLLGDLFQLLLDGVADRSAIAEREEDLVEELVHALGVDAVGEAPDDEGRVVEAVGNADLGRNNVLVIEGPGNLLAGVNVIKPLLSVTDKEVKKARAFVPDKLFLSLPEWSTSSSC